MKIAASIFKTLFLCLCIIANTHLAYAQTASILPQGKTQFLDNNGKPLTSGTVDFYIPSTTTRKTTWQNSAETVANSNPVVLDAGGRAIIYGDGSYRQVVKDRLGNVIWDQVTSSTGSGSTPVTATGDGDLVGTIKPWAGLTAPNQYVFTYGQEISRTTYSALFTAITSSQSVFCTSGSPTLTGLSDTTNFWVGASVEVSCLAAGFSTIISKTSSSITLASNANVSTNVTAIIFPWGRGNGTTTFNVPDLRGFAIAGNNNMGGVASSQLNTTYFGATDPNSVGAAGGNQSVTLVKGNIPSYTLTSSVTQQPTFSSDGSKVTATVNTVYGGGASGPTNFVTGTTGATVTRVNDVTISVTSGGSGTSFSRVQPTKTTNYIIKITPDTNSATASGVTSLGGMTGDIACGTGLLCTGNIISASGSSLLASNNVWTGTNTFNNAAGITVLGAQFWANSTACSLYIGFNAAAAIVPSACGAHSGDINTFIGYASGAANTTGFANTFLGTSAGNATTTGDSNTYLGAQSGILGTTANANVGIGVDALFNNILGQDNTYVGHHVGVNNVFAAAAGQATVIGAEAAKTGVGAVGQTLVGYRSGYNNNASALGSSMFGNLAGFTNTSGNQNTYIGQEAGFTGLTGGVNTSIGYRSGYTNSTGTGNVNLGAFAGFYETNSDRLYIDNNDRGSLGAAPTAALIYGVFNTVASSQTLAFNAATGIRNNATTAFTVGPNGTTNPVFTIDASTASQAAGLKVTGAATGGTVSIIPTDSGSNTNIAYNAKGSGTMAFGTVSTGAVTLGGGGGAVTVNGLGVTASTGTLTVTNSKTLSISNTMTQTATDGSTVAFGAGGTVSYTVASGTKALATSAISSATCTSAQTDTATGATTSSVVDASFASDPTAVTGYTPATTGMLTIISYATANTVNFKVCNNTTGSITPGAISLNWRVRS